MVTTRAALIGAVPLTCGACGRGLDVRRLAYMFAPPHALPRFLWFAGVSYENRSTY
jgi:hypothetical protein